MVQVPSGRGWRISTDPIINMRGDIGGGNESNTVQILEIERKEWDWRIFQMA